MEEPLLRDLVHATRGCVYRHAEALTQELMREEEVPTNEGGGGLPHLTTKLTAGNDPGTIEEVHQWTGCTQTSRGIQLQAHVMEEAHEYVFDFGRHRPLVQIRWPWTLPAIARQVFPQAPDGKTGGWVTYPTCFALQQVWDDHSAPWCVRITKDPSSSPRASSSALLHEHGPVFPRLATSCYPVHLFHSLVMPQTPGEQRTRRTRIPWGHALVGLHCLMSSIPDGCALWSADKAARERVEVTLCLNTCRVPLVRQDEVWHLRLGLWPTDCGDMPELCRVAVVEVEVQWASPDVAAQTVVHVLYKGGNALCNRPEKGQAPVLTTE